MKTIKVASAKDVTLDWLVAKCAGWEPGVYMREAIIHKDVNGKVIGITVPISREYRWYRPSTDWSQGGPIMDREEILIMGTRGRYQAWIANKTTFGPLGETHLIAAMRCWVMFKLGETAEVPEELT